MAPAQSPSSGVHDLAGCTQPSMSEAFSPAALVSWSRELECCCWRWQISQAAAGPGSDVLLRLTPTLWPHPPASHSARWPQAAAAAAAESRLQQHPLHFGLQLLPSTTSPSPPPARAQAGPELLLLAGGEGGSRRGSRLCQHPAHLPPGDHAHLPQPVRLPGRRSRPLSQHLGPGGAPGILPGESLRQLRCVTLSCHVVQLMQVPGAAAACYTGKPGLQIGHSLCPAVGVWLLLAPWHHAGLPEASNSTTSWA